MKTPTKKIKMADSVTHKDTQTLDITTNPKLKHPFLSCIRQIGGYITHMDWVQSFFSDRPSLLSNLNSYNKICLLHF